MLNTLEKVHEIVLKEVPDLNVQIEPAHQITQDLGIDSLTFVDILVKIEEDFGIEITDDELGTVQSIQDILDLIQKKQ